MEIDVETKKEIQGKDETDLFVQWNFVVALSVDVISRDYVMMSCLCF